MKLKIEISKKEYTRLTKPYVKIIKNMSQITIGDWEYTKEYIRISKVLDYYPNYKNNIVNVECCNMNATYNLIAEYHRDENYHYFWQYEGSIRGFGRHDECIPLPFIPQTILSDDWEFTTHYDMSSFLNTKIRVMKLNIETPVYFYENTWRTSTRCGRAVPYLLLEYVRQACINENKMIADGTDMWGDYLCNMKLFHFIKKIALKTSKQLNK